MEKRLLIIQTAFLGDLILTTPLIHEIRKKYSNYKISILVNKGTESVLDSSPDVDEVIPFDKKKIKKNLTGFIDFVRKIRRKNFGIVISPHFSYRSSLIAFFSGAETRIGYKEAGFSFLYTEKIHRPLRGMHEVDKLYSLIFSENEFPEHKRPYLTIDPVKIRKVNESFSKLKITAGKYIVVAPSSVWETKRMPEEKFIEVIRLIDKKLKIPVVLIGGPGDRNLCKRIAAGAGGKKIYNFAGETSLIDLSWVIKNAKGIVTNDSSPIHFASAHNVPTVAVFGATIAGFGYTPLAEKSFIAEVNGLDCRPCGIHGGNNCPQKHFRCMKDQSPEMITDHLVKLIK